MKEEISKIIEENLKRSMNILIESFVMYYGEEYRDIIRQNVLETEVIVYIYDNPLYPKILKDSEIRPSYDFYKLFNLSVELINEIKKREKNYKKENLYFQISYMLTHE